MWTATITNKQLSGNTLSVTLTFTSGKDSFTQTFSSQSQPSDTWLEDEAKAVIDNLTSLETYAATISVDDVVG